MSEPFVAEIRIFAGNFAPRGWAFCNGQLLPISQNTALFSLIGTTYGGDGETVTQLPNLQGRVPMHPGRGPGLTSRRLGQRGGVENVTLSEAQIANHNHQQSLRVDSSPGDAATPEGNVFARSPVSSPYSTTQENLKGKALQSSGDTLPHNNLQPFLTMNFIIALVGLYPSRS